MLDYKVLVSTEKYKIKIFKSAYGIDFTYSYI